MIKITNLYKTYNIDKPNECKALKDINVTFPNNGLFIIKGKSGSGKSTLLNIIAGFDTPTKGSIDTNYNSNNYSSFIFQEFELIDYLTVEENIKLFNKDEVLFNELINKYELNNILNHKPNEISGGQKQRVSLVRALMDNKPVLLCDEPTGNLDSLNAKNVYDMLYEISKEKLVIVVTHDYELFNKNDGFIEIKDGEIIDNNIKEISDNNKIEVHDNKLSFNSKWLIIKNFIKNNKAKHIFFIISIFLSVLLLYTSLSIIFSSKSKIIYNTYENSNLPVDMAKMATLNSYASLSGDELSEYNDKYNSIPFYEFYFTYTYEDILKVKKIYVTNQTTKNLIYGTNVLNDYEIIISDYNAFKINSDLSKVCGNKIGSYTIVGIFKTNYKQDTKIDDNSIDLINFYSVYMNDSSYKYFKSYFSSYSFQFRYRINDGNSEINSGLAHSFKELNNGEAIINYSMYYHCFNGTSVDEVIGKTIDIYFINNYTYSNEMEKYEFKIVGIDNNEVYFSENDYGEINQKFNINFHDDIINGISLENPSIKTIKKAINDGFGDYGIYSVQIDEASSWVKPWSYVFLAISVIMAIIAMIIVVNFISIIMDKEKKTVGVLSSFGIDKSKITILYFLDVLFFSMIAIFINAFFEIFIIYLLNLVTKKYIKVSMNVVFYSYLGLLLLIISFMVLIFVIYLIFRNKINKKQKIDLIYQR